MRAGSRVLSHKRGRSGSALIEVLVAACIVGFDLAVMVSLWQFSYQMTTKVDDKGVACNLARQTIEAIKQTGFDYTPEVPAATPSLHYFGTLQQNLDTLPTTARYKVATTVVSDTFSGTNPDPSALRTVIVKVTLTLTGEVLYQTSYYQARSGI